MSRRQAQVIESSSEDEVMSDASSDENYRPSKAKAAKRSRNSTAHDSQPSQSQSVSQALAPAELTPTEVVRLAGLVANYFLAAECKKIPVKRADLSKVVGKQHAKRVQIIIDEASSMLQKIYGYKVVELSKRKNSYLLMNLLAAPINSASRDSSGTDTSSEEDEKDDLIRVEEPGDERQGLLFLVLTVVFMQGDLAEEVTLSSFLKQLGVNIESADPHPVYGNCKKLLDDMVKQCYLELTIQKDLEPPGRHYSWGERAHLQVCKRAMLEIVCRVYGGGLRPENWVDQWAVVMGGSSSSSTSVGSSVEELC